MSCTRAFAPVHLQYWNRKTIPCNCVKHDQQIMLNYLFEFLQLTTLAQHSFKSMIADQLSSDSFLNLIYHDKISNFSSFLSLYASTSDTTSLVMVCCLCTKFDPNPNRKSVISKLQWKQRYINMIVCSQLKLACGRCCFRFRSKAALCLLLSVSEQI